MWDKLQHEMYWNYGAMISLSTKLIDKLQHEMYWNSGMLDLHIPMYGINYNMRCIETLMSFDEVDKLTG